MVIAEEYREIAPGVFAWKAYDTSVRCDLWSTAFTTPGGLIVVDPVELRPELGVRFEAIILTSGNHERAAAVFRERLQIPIWAPLEAIPALDGLHVDHPFDEGDVLPGGWTAIKIPSAGPGEVALFGDGVLCFGDAVINLPSTGLALLPEKYCKNAPGLRDDVRKLLSCDFEIVTFAHGEPIVENAKQRLQQLLA